MEQAEFRDPRLVAVYDAEYGWSRIDELFLGLANETPCVRVLDLGCGAGRLALALAAAGHQVTGLGPAVASLAAARAKPDANTVSWGRSTGRGTSRGRRELIQATPSGAAASSATHRHPARRTAARIYA